MTDSATFTPPEASDEDLGDLLLEVLPGDGSTIGNQSAREALGRVVGRQISEEEYETVRDKAHSTNTFNPSLEGGVSVYTHKYYRVSGITPRGEVLEVSTRPLKLRTIGNLNKLFVVLNHGIVELLCYSFNFHNIN